MLFHQDAKLMLDERASLEAADNLRTTGLYHSQLDFIAYGLECVRPPLVTFLLVIAENVGIHSVTEMRLGFAVICGLLPIPLFFTARGLGSSFRLSAVLGALCSLHPFMILVSSRLLTEGLFALLLSATFALVFHWRSSTGWKLPVLTGIILGLTCLCRPTALVLIPVLPIVWLFFSTGRYRAFGLVSALCALVTIAPWEVFVYHEYCCWVPITTSGSYNLWNVSNSQRGDMTTTLPEDMKEKLSAMTERERVRYFRQESMNWIHSHRAEFWDIRRQNFLRFWKLWPADFWNRKIAFRQAYGVAPVHPYAIALAKVLWFITVDGLLILSLVGLFLYVRKYPAEMLSFAGCILGATALHTLMTSGDRYR